MKILFGICGIGSGHTFRQLPLVEHFSQDNEVMIFAYGDSYDFYKKKFPDIPIARVAVPFYASDKNGIDFNATAQKDCNRQDFVTINAAAMAAAEQRLGRPDLVVSDYEPVSAQYAYAQGSKLVTVDQQSKYLVGDFPEILNGTGYKNEVQMLRMFFPKAEARLACSFFRVAEKKDSPGDVELCPPVFNDSITRIARTPPADKTSILLYISSQQPFGQSPADVAAVCGSLPDVEFHVFGRNTAAYAAPNVKTYEHGDPRFHGLLSTCSGIVATAGHTLLSEAMHLGIPVYAVPLPLYEQQMNAHVIHENGFGVSHPRLDAAVLAGFVRDIPLHAAAIAADRSVLLRAPGQDVIIDRLRRHLASAPRIPA